MCSVVVLSARGRGIRRYSICFLLGGAVADNNTRRGVRRVRAVMPKRQATQCCTDARPTDRVRADCKLVGIWITTTCRRDYAISGVSSGLTLYGVRVCMWSIHKREVEIIIYIMATFPPSLTLTHRFLNDNYRVRTISSLLYGILCT